MLEIEVRPMPVDEVIEWLSSNAEPTWWQAVDDRRIRLSHSLLRYVLEAYNASILVTARRGVFDAQDVDLLLYGLRFILQCKGTDCYTEAMDVPAELDRLLVDVGDQYVRLYG